MGENKVFASCDADNGAALGTRSDNSVYGYIFHPSSVNRVVSESV